MEEITLERDGMGPLSFTGDILAFVTTFREGKRRWSEFRIWTTDTGRYVVEILGCSDVPNERTMRTVRTADSALALVKSFVSKDHGRISNPAVELLELTAERDQDVDDALDVLYETERI